MKFYKETQFEDTDIGEIPKGWTVAEIGEISSEVYRYPTYYNIEYTDEGVPEIRGELIKDRGELENDIGKYRHVSYETSARFPKTIVKEGDFVISVRATMGKIGVVPKLLEGANITANLMRISLDSSRCRTPFFRQVFLSQEFKRMLRLHSSETTIKTIQSPILKSIKLPLPPIPEQERIASILCKLDETIQKTEEIIQKTEKFKKGLMQELLTKGIGHKEFEFSKQLNTEIPTQWGVVRLRETGNNDQAIVAGPFGSNLKVSDYKPEGVPIIRLQNIERNRFVDKDTKYISTEKAEELRYHSYEPGDLVLAKLGDPIGKTCIVPDSMQSGIVVADVVRIRPSPKKANTCFLEYILNSFICLMQWKKETIGSTRPRVNISQIRNVLISLPSLAEQERIAQILSSLDEKIDKEMRTKAQLERLRSGLMQILLTGKVRVKVN